MPKVAQIAYKPIQTLLNKEIITPTTIEKYTDPNGK